jgi:peptide/nickel transport system permease protein
VTFAVARLIPGDPAVTWAGPRATPAELAQVHRDLGLDRPLPVQLGDYVAGVATGDLGVSLHTRRAVLADLGDRVPASLELVGSGIAIALLLGTALGLAAARWRGRWPDALVRAVSVGAVSMPVFWLGLILQLIFFQRLGLLPAAGRYDAALDDTSPLHQITHVVTLDALLTGNWAVLGSALRHLVLPALVIAAYPLGLVARIVRAAVGETLAEDHADLARSLGFGERGVMTRFALRPSMSPVASVLALAFGYSLTNAFLVEAVFAWPGLGSYAADAIRSLDTPAIIGVTLVVASLYVLANLLVDLVQAALDPRVRVR